MFEVRRTLAAAFVAALALVSTSITRAGVIYSAQSVVSAPPNAGVTSWTATINQSGLVTPYVSGVTDFGSYVSTNPQHNGNNLTIGATFTNPPFSITLDLGAVLPVKRIAFWNYHFSNGGGISQMNIVTSPDVSFSVVSSGGTVFPVDRSNPVPVEVLDVTDTVGRYVRLDIVSAYGSVSGAGFDEIAFEVPEPAVMPLVGVAMAILRRRHAADDGHLP